ncbi:MAG: hypothetical protein ABJC09_11560 [Terriglobia bacterium]
MSADPKLSVLIVDGMNNHDWAAGTRAIRSILESSGRFSVEVATWPAKPGGSLRSRRRKDRRDAAQRLEQHGY